MATSKNDKKAARKSTRKTASHKFDKSKEHRRCGPIGRRIRELGQDWLKQGRTELMAEWTDK